MQAGVPRAPVFRSKRGGMRAWLQRRMPDAPSRFAPQAARMCDSIPDPEASPRRPIASPTTGAPIHTVFQVFRNERTQRNHRVSASLARGLGYNGGVLARANRFVLRAGAVMRRLVAVLASIVLAFASIPAVAWGTPSPMAAGAMSQDRVERDFKDIDAGRDGGISAAT